MLSSELARPLRANHRGTSLSTAAKESAGLTPGGHQIIGCHAARACPLVQRNGRARAKTLLVDVFLGLLSLLIAGSHLSILCARRTIGTHPRLHPGRSHLGMLGSVL